MKCGSDQAAASAKMLHQKRSLSGVELCANDHECRPDNHVEITSRSVIKLMVSLLRRQTTASRGLIVDWSIASATPTATLKSRCAVLIDSCTKYLNTCEKIQLRGALLNGIIIDPGSRVHHNFFISILAGAPKAA